MSQPRQISDIIAQLTAQIEEAYARGFRDGSEATRERILRAASIVPVNKAPSTPAEDDLKEGSSGERVERGTVRRAVQKVLAETPGLTIAEIGRRVVQVDSRVAATSVSNELNRNEGRLYSRHEGRWFPVGIGQGNTFNNEEGHAGEPARPSYSNGAGELSA